MRGWGDLMGGGAGNGRGGAYGDAGQLAQMMMGGGFHRGGGVMTRRFEEQYHCYSVAYADKAHLEVCSSTFTSKSFIHRLCIY